MRETPTWRIPAGVLMLCAGLAIYATAVARWLAPLFAGWPTLVQVPIYLVLGVIWLLPLRRFLIWMETGRWT
jgi:thiosulfate reductase cytochrome b subunit